MYFSSSFYSRERNVGSRFTLLFLVLLLTALTLSSCTAPASKVVPEAEPEEEYVYHRIKYSGETVAVISAWYTKSAKNWPEIVDANPKMVPSKLRIGDYVRIPKRLMRRNSSLPQDFVASFKSGVNKDSSKGETAPDTSVVTTAIDSGQQQDFDSQTDKPSTQASDFTVEETTSVDRAPLEADKPSESEKKELDLLSDKPDLDPVINENKPDSGSLNPGTTNQPAANDENQKIREQLMQELLQ